ncbi:hypothetical protein DTL42_05260 [Bremerella cremea]|uniref:Secreted protein n=1 Tax=Bremerella cremea TaxID=1031537 RepID=A0A368KY04_9BACT|nr:hypothetical protein [Bremerella cremea]RCS54547.1 hypothetical protein DTL42_05260 [Bremerella cremea]
MPNLTRLTAWAILLAAPTFALADPDSKQEGSSLGSAWMNNSMLDGDAATQKIQQEVEKLRQELGAEFSLESKELGITFVRDEKEPAVSQQNSLSSADGPLTTVDSTEIDALLLTICQKTQAQARQLEQLAADAETRMDYPLADRLRTIAQQQWQAARMIRNPVNHTENTCNSCLSNDLGSCMQPQMSSFPQSPGPGIQGPGPGILFPFFGPTSLSPNYTPVSPPTTD